MTFQSFDPHGETSIFARRLPHWQQPGVTYFVTFRLGDSLPQEKLRAWTEERVMWLRVHGIRSIEEIIQLDPEKQREFSEYFGEQLQKWLDVGYGECWLEKPEVAGAVERTFRHFDGERYLLGEFVIMPNHVHVLVTLAEGVDIPTLLHSWKSYSAKQINELVGRTGPVWQHESYDHIVRSEEQLRHFERYIRENPAKAGLKEGRFRLGWGKGLPSEEALERAVSSESKLEACSTLAERSEGAPEGATSSQGKLEACSTLAGHSEGAPEEAASSQSKLEACSTLAEHSEGAPEGAASSQSKLEACSTLAEHSEGAPEGATSSQGKLEACSTLKSFKIRHFRCFEAFEAEFDSGLNLIIGPNAHGKTSLLEAACILLRLQSPRTSRLTDVIQHERRGFVVDGYFGERHLQFYYSKERKKLALDSVEQKSAQEYLQIGHVVYFSNSDIEVVRGSGDARRRFLDFVLVQSDSGYRRALRDYERALRSRNLLLKASSPRWREIAAFDEPLIATGERLIAARRNLLAELQPLAEDAHRAISGGREVLRLEYQPGSGEDFKTNLAAAQAEDARLRQTTVGPHRDDVELLLNERSSGFASEGQQRTLVLALKLGAARLLAAHFEAPPVLLLDDIFGELDPVRRAALLHALPAGAQQLITTTNIGWLPPELSPRILQLG